MWWDIHKCHAIRMSPHDLTSQHDALLPTGDAAHLCDALMHQGVCVVIPGGSTDCCKGHVLHYRSGAMLPEQGWRALLLNS
jgi:hypothetical protein